MTTIHWNGKSRWQRLRSSSGCLMRTLRFAGRRCETWRVRLRTRSAAERAKVATEGWGFELLSRQGRTVTGVVRRGTAVEFHDARPDVVA
jgi:hypothetical protein